MLKKCVTFVAAAGAVAGIVFGCSSSSTTNPDTTDGSVPVDSGKRDSGGTGVDSGGGDGSADLCTPPATVQYTKKWIPPHPHQNACSQANIDLYFKVCLGTQADGGAACKSYEATPAGKTCEACLLPSTVTNLGALVPDGHFVSPNVAGCIAILQGTVTDGAGCASANLYDTECGQAACGACSQDANSTVDQINNCDNAATSGACAAEFAADQACQNGLADGGTAAAVCTQGTDFPSAFNIIAPIFCLDNGDGGTGDASDGSDSG